MQVTVFNECFNANNVLVCSDNVVLLITHPLRQFYQLHKYHLSIVFLISNDVIHLFKQICFWLTPEWSGSIICTCVADKKLH